MRSSTQRGHGHNQHKEAQHERGVAESLAFAAKVRKWCRKKNAQAAPPPVAVRPMRIDDASHVIDSWVRSFRPSPTVGPVEAPVFHIEQRARINRLISRSKTFVACDPEDKSRIRGWIVFEPPRRIEDQAVIHYVCVHPNFQVQGIGSALVGIARGTQADAEAPIWSTHETQPMRHIRPRWNMFYNPYLLEMEHKAPTKTAIGHAEGAWDPYGFTQIPRA